MIDAIPLEAAVPIIILLWVGLALLVFGDAR